MRAAILAVGSELLGTERLDTNSLHLTEVLHRHGVTLIRKSVAADDEDQIAAEVETALDRCALLLVCGGLGPTADDVTREGVARALGRKLERRPELERELEAKFRSFGLEMPEVNRKQAEVLEGAEVIANRRGTAPGQRLDEPRGTVFLMPGVPSELRAMVDEALEPWLGEHSTGDRVETEYLKVACLPESTLEERIQPYYQRFGRHEVTILASAGDLTLAVTSGGADGSRRRRIAERLELLRSLLGESVYGDRRDASLEAVVGELLAGRGESVTTAESCTGGLVAERLTRVEGSSAYFVGGAVAYANEIKTRLLGVRPATLDAHGAVSRPVVEEMARGARRRFGTDWAMAVSGIAGPGGGTPEKPVGTVHLAVAGPGDQVEHRARRLPGDRARVRWMASQWALDLLRRRLLAVSEALAS